MPGPYLSTTRNVWLDMRMLAREQIRNVDGPAWRRFFLALFGLTLSFFLALYATALRESGRYELAAVTAALSLLLAGIVAIRAVPYLARRTALERWMLKIEYELTREGVIYLTIIAVIAVAALNTGNNLLFVMLACLLAGILVSGILSKIVLSDVELEFTLPEHLFAQQPTLSRVTIQNWKWLLPSFSITVSAWGALKTKPQAVNAKLSGIGARASGFGTPKAQRPAVKVKPLARILDEPVYVPYIPRRSSVTQHLELTFPRRGRYTQEGLRISTRFPFAFVRKARQVPARQEILVLPNVQPTEEFYEILPLLSGELESFYKGRGHDLYAIRDYQESDPARHVDWKATAKAQQLKVREFTREDERRVVLVFDARLPRTDEKTRASFEKAVTLGACLAWHFYEIDAQMQLVSQNLEIPMALAGEIIYRVLEALAVVQPTIGQPTFGQPRIGEPQFGTSAAADNLLTRIASDGRTFNIILTSQPRGSIPTSLWGCSYIIFMNSL